LGEQLEKLGNLMGTHREHDGNKGKKVKIPPLLLPKKKKTGPLMSPF
jgi:hypothetical protein